MNDQPSFPLSASCFKSFLNTHFDPSLHRSGGPGPPLQDCAEAHSLALIHFPTTCVNPPLCTLSFSYTMYILL